MKLRASFKLIFYAFEAMSDDDLRVDTLAARLGEYSMQKKGKGRRKSRLDQKSSAGADDERQASRTRRSVQQVIKLVPASWRRGGRASKLMRYLETKINKLVEEEESPMIRAMRAEQQEQERRHVRHTRARIRWWLAYMLLRNPRLRPLRVHAASIEPPRVASSEEPAEVLWV